MFNLLGEIAANVASLYLGNTKLFKAVAGTTKTPKPQPEKPMDPTYRYINPSVRSNGGVPIPYDPARINYGASVSKPGLILAPWRQEQSAFAIPGSLIPNGNITAAPENVVSDAGQELYGYPRIAVKSVTLALDTLTSDQLFGLQGTVLWAVSASASTASIKVRFNDQQSDQITWGPGNGLEGIPFERVYLSWAAQAGVTIQLAYFIDTSRKPVRFF